MAILDKIKTITSVFGRLIPGRSGFGGYNYGYPQSGGIFQVSKDALIAFVEKYKGIRRLILAIVLWINIHIFLVTTHMYKLNGSIDMQWVIFAGYWSAILATFVAFYTMARTNESNPSGLRCVIGGPYSRDDSRSWRGSIDEVLIWKMQLNSANVKRAMYMFHPIQ